MIDEDELNVMEQIIKKNMFCIFQDKMYFTAATNNYFNYQLIFQLLS